MILVHQQVHQLGYGNGGMGIIELDGNLAGKVVERFVEFTEAMENILQGSAHEKKLLFETQFPAHQGGVIGIKHFRKILGVVLFLDRFDVIAFVEILEFEIARRLGRPEPHIVHDIIGITRNRGVICHRHDFLRIHPLVMIVSLLIDILHHMAEKLDRIEHFRPGKLPGIAVSQPVVRVLDLLPFFDTLIEHAVLVTYPATVSGQTERRHGIEKTGGQPSQPAVAQPCIGLDFAQFIEIQPQCGQRFPALFIKADIAEAVYQHATDEKLHGKIINPLRVFLVIAAHGFHPGLRKAIPYRISDGMKPVALCRSQRILADGIGQSVCQGMRDAADITPKLFMIENNGIDFFVHDFSRK